MSLIKKHEWLLKEPWVFASFVVGDRFLKREKNNIGENIFPTGITAMATRVCKIKPSENLMILILDANYRELDVKPFSDTQEIADELEKLAETNNPEKCYVDILMPNISFQQVQNAKKSKM